MANMFDEAAAGEFYRAAVRAIAQGEGMVMVPALLPTRPNTVIRSTTAEARWGKSLAATVPEVKYREGITPIEVLEQAIARTDIAVRFIQELEELGPDNNEPTIASVDEKP